MTKSAYVIAAEMAATQILVELRLPCIGDIRNESDLDRVIRAYMSALSEDEQVEEWAEAAAICARRMTAAIGDAAEIGRLIDSVLYLQLEKRLLELEPDACRLLSEMQRLSHADAELDRRAAG